MIASNKPQDAKAVHVLSSGLKAAATWGRVETLQFCREVRVCVCACVCVSVCVCVCRQ